MCDKTLKALSEQLSSVLNIRTESKSTDKLIAVLSTLASLDWSRIRSADLEWEEVGSELVPSLRITTVN